MFIPSPEIIQLFNVFSSCFSTPTLSKAIKLACGAILSPGRRTVTSALRAIGCDQSKDYGKYHRFLSRDRWSALHLINLLLSLLLKVFIAEDKPIDIVVDETLERCYGKKISYKGWFRDAVRSTYSTTVTTPGIRWLCFCLLVSLPWSQRRWALPFFTIPACSEKNCQKRKRLHRSSTIWTDDILFTFVKWLGKTHPIRLIGDGGFTSAKLLQTCQGLGITQIGRFRMDAALYDAHKQTIINGDVNQKKDYASQTLKTDWQIRRPNGKKLKSPCVDHMANFEDSSDNKDTDNTQID